VRDAALSRIRLRHLQCFLAVAQFGNLRRAAQALSITQPAVTKTLNELEALLARPLFLRGRHGATLTSEGETFMRHAGDSVHALGRAVDSVLSDPETAPLRVGVLPTVAPSFLPAVLQAFGARWPQCSVRVSTGRNTQLIEQLRNRELDLVLGRHSDPELMAGLSFEHLYAEPVVVVLRPGHALAPRKAAGAKTRAAPALAAFGSYPLVLPPAGTLIRQVTDGFLSRHGISPKAGCVETMDTSLARALALHGDNLWFTPLGSVQPDLEAGTLLRLGVDLTPEEAVGLILRTEASISAAVTDFIKAVRSHAGAGRAHRKRRAVR
jgi:LysR family transcriptional regulator, pca operon transcriptional activator